jgi:hypothetical protein
METAEAKGSWPKPGPEQSNPWRELPRFVVVVSTGTLVIVTAIVLAAALATGFSLVPQRVLGAEIGSSGTLNWGSMRGLGSQQLILTNWFLGNGASL